MPDAAVDSLRLLHATWLGRVDYRTAWDLQRALFDGLVTEPGTAPARDADVMLTLEHPPTYTLGRRGIEADLVYSEQERTARGISLYNVDRGGRATYHGPGQLVGYPILALGVRYDVIGYLRRLEEGLIRTLRDFGVEAGRDVANTGVWVRRSKIAAIGVKVTRGVTMHGFALNVATDLTKFDGIVPCGLTDRGTTSILAETGEAPDLQDVAKIAATHLANVFDRVLQWKPPGEITSAAPGARVGALH